MNRFTVTRGQLNTAGNARATTETEVGSVVRWGASAIHPDLGVDNTYDGTTLAQTIGVDASGVSTTTQYAYKWFDGAATSTIRITSEAGVAANRIGNWLLQ